MVNKRLIFTLLYDQGQFTLSRNFRLQKVGDLAWLQTHYNFSKISYSIDELIVLDVSRTERSPAAFCDALKALTQGCFVPIAAGGGIRSIEAAHHLLRSGADKIVVNTALFENEALIADLASEFGQQCIVAAIDIKRAPNGDFQIWVESGAICLDGSASSRASKAARGPIGELYLNSMDRDGTGQGYDFQLLELIGADINKPVILAGGAGNAAHLAEGLANQRVDAVATAHLFNFVGDGLKNARQTLIAGGIDLPVWDIHLLEQRLGAKQAGDVELG